MQEQSCDDRKSISGYIFMFVSGTISWSSKKQPIVTLSTIEAEFVAASSIMCLLRHLADEYFATN
jgi:hypothetical protein